MANPTHTTDMKIGENVAGEPTPELNPEAGLPSAAAFAGAESQEILNLLGDSDGGSCCGGGCCSV